jgi:hypothetical protein
MIDVGGRPMIRRVIEALRDARQIEDIVVVGLDQAADRAQLQGLNIAHFIPHQGSMPANGFAGMRWLRHEKPHSDVVLGCSSDIPHLHGHMVDDLIDRCRPFDRLLYYPVVRRSLLEAAYPGSNRTYTKFKGGVQIAGGDMFIFQTAFLDSNPTLWEKITNARKNPLQVARLVGWLTLLKLLLRQLSIEEAAATGGRLLGSDRPVGIVYTPFAELAMDGDKPHQVELLREKYTRS